GVGDKEPVRFCIEDERCWRAEARSEDLCTARRDRILINSSARHIGHINHLSSFIECNRAELGCVRNARNEGDVLSVEIEPVKLIRVRGSYIRRARVRT